MTLRALADQVLSLLLAPPCAVCGHVLDQPLDGAVCGACWTSLQPHPSSFSLHAISSARAIGLYELTLRDVIHALKYDGRRSIAPHLSRLMAQHGASILEGADAVIPVPLHRRRLRQRGFNQAADLARGLGRPTMHALRRIRPTDPQVDLPAPERRENVRDAFALAHQDTRAAVAGAILVLVDDVTTTGATLEACARVLRNADAKDVRALTAARVASAPP